MVNKNMTFKLLLCEEDNCSNNIGYAGALIHNLKTDQRKVLCLICAKMPKYKDWTTEMVWN